MSTFMAVVTLTVLWSGEKRRRVPALEQRALRTYWSMVILEVILLPVGTAVLSRMHHPELSVPWVALIVGLHFLPLGKAFRMPGFQALAWTLIALGIIGGVLAVAVGASTGTFVAGVLSGLALLVFALNSNLAMHRRGTQKAKRRRRYPFPVSRASPGLNTRPRANKSMP